MEKVLSVPGMTCNHCKTSVTEALRKLVGVSRVEVNLETKRVSVTFDEQQVKEPALRQAIEDVGFELG
jgi:copper chaperone